MKDNLFYLIGINLIVCFLHERNIHETGKISCFLDFPTGLRGVILP